MSEGMYSLPFEILLKAFIFMHSPEKIFRYITDHNTRRRNGVMSSHYLGSRKWPLLKQLCSVVTLRWEASCWLSDSLHLNNNSIHNTADQEDHWRKKCAHGNEIMTKFKATFNKTPGPSLGPTEAFCSQHYDTFTFSLASSEFCRIYKLP